jgi:hypothetical protein
VSVEIDLPAAFLELDEFLQTEGFTRRVEGPFGQYSDFCVMLRRDNLVVTMVSERGGWSVLAGRAGWREGFEPFVWRVCLTEGPVTTVDPTPATEADWLREHLAHVSQAVNAPWLSRRRLQDCLRISQRAMNMELLTPEAVARNAERDSTE